MIILLECICYRYKTCVKCSILGVIMCASLPSNGEHKEPVDAKEKLLPLILIVEK